MHAKRRLQLGRHARLAAGIAAQELRRAVTLQPTQPSATLALLGGRGRALQQGI